MYRVTLTSGPRRFFESADAPLQRRLDRCFARLASNPRRHNNIKSLKGDWSGYLRYRIGVWRVIYRIDEAKQLVLVTDIAHRREARQRDLKSLARFVHLNLK